MKLEVDLDLLGARFRDLSATPYFRKNVRSYAHFLSEATQHISTNIDNQSDNVRRAYCRHLWRIYKYIAGSTVSESPYEMEYCLSLALKEWISKECAIATTLSMDLDFHFLPIDAQGIVKSAGPSFSNNAFDVILAPMALPRIYKHRPLYCSPLYHELGHFVDVTYGIAVTSLMIQAAPQIHSDPAVNLRISQSHRAEHFCDLFAAQYIGKVASASLEEIAPNAPISVTHPATADRTKIISDFLSGTANPLVDAFQAALHARGAPKLEIRHAAIAVDECLDDIRPIPVSSVHELHGLFPAVWDYLDGVRAGKSKAWTDRGMQYPAIDQAVNDLLEKSIRNRSIVEMW